MFWQSYDYMRRCGSCSTNCYIRFLSLPYMDSLAIRMLMTIYFSSDASLCHIQLTAIMTCIDAINSWMSSNSLKLNTDKHTVDMVGHCTTTCQSEHYFDHSAWYRHQCQSLSRLPVDLCRLCEETDTSLLLPATTVYRVLYIIFRRCEGTSSPSYL